MPQSFEKLKGHIALGLSVHLSIRPNKFEDRVLNFHKWIPHQRITDLYLPLWSYALSKGHNVILYQRYLKTTTASRFKLGQLIEDNE